MIPDGHHAGDLALKTCAQPDEFSGSEKTIMCYVIGADGFVMITAWQPLEEVIFSKIQQLHD